VTKTFVIVGEKTETVVCVQPIAADCTLLPLMGDDPSFNPEEDDACDVQPAYAALLQPVSFGRASVARASAVVIDKAYYEALANINLAAAVAEAEGTVPYALDPAGRLVLTLLDELTSLPVAKTIDAPLENLGLYRAVMTAGCLGPVTIEREPGVPLTMALTAEGAGHLGTLGLGHLVCGATTAPDQMDLFRAAGFYAGAADKSDPVTLDEIINLNTYLGINTYTTGTTGKARREVTIVWFKFEFPAGTPFTYARAVTHPATPAAVGGFVLPAGATILTDAGPGLFQAQTLASLFAGSPPGVDLEAVDVQVCRAGVPYAACTVTPDPNEVCGGANWFAQTTEDARKIVWFLHNWEVPEIGY
jgi:hypothetical protein